MKQDMDVTLEKIDAVRGTEHDESETEVLRLRGEDLMRALAAIVRRGNASRIVVRNGDYVVADIPVTLGVVSAALAPWITLFATMALLVSSWTLEIKRPAAPAREPVIP